MGETGDDSISIEHAYTTGAVARARANNGSFNYYCMYTLSVEQQYSAVVLRAVYSSAQVAT